MGIDCHFSIKDARWILSPRLLSLYREGEHETHNNRRQYFFNEGAGRRGIRGLHRIDILQSFDKLRNVNAAPQKSHFNVHT